MKIIANEYIGGCLGNQDYGSCQMEKCSFSVEIIGNKYIGGIFGYASNNTEIFSCKSDVNIKGNGCGIAYGTPTIYASYSTGYIESDYGSDVYAIGVNNTPCYHCYTTVTSNAELYIPVRNECTSIYNSDNIARDMKEFYSEFLWRFL